MHQDITAEQPAAYEKPLLTPEEFKKLIGIGRNSVYGLLEARKIKSIRVGRKILIPRSELQDFLVREAQ